MFKSIRKRGMIVGVIAALAVSVAAFAYFTNNGSGSGSASVGTSSGIELSGSAVGNLYPDGADVPATVSIHNPGSGAQHVGTISGTVASVGDCDGSWFEVDDIAYDSTLAAGGSDTAGTNVRMVDNGGNQDACQNAALTITWSSN